jgi:prevent-host-death family protein
MRKMDIRDALAPLSEYALRVTEEPLVLTKNGKPWAAVISLKKNDWESISLSTNPDFIDMLQESRRRLRTKGGISTAEMRKRLGLKSKRQRGKKS